MTEAYGVSKRTVYHFNPHPHVEGDSKSIVPLNQERMISIHTLTWRVTKAIVDKMGADTISIHTLTWRVTEKEVKWNETKIHFNPHPHVEGDYMEYTDMQIIKKFQSTPSRGG